MGNRRIFLAICFIQLFIIDGCGQKLQDNNKLPNQTERVPFDYNKRNIYVFSVKAFNASNTLFYADTLGLMCTNKVCQYDSTQKMICWLYLTATENDTYTFNPAKNNNNGSGIISSKEELFLHPQRIDQYTILEICPYPYLRFPLFIGKKWDWDLNVGSQYCPGGAIIWKGNELFKSAYEVADTLRLESGFGKISCYQIHATNNSRFGKSSADFYYSYKYGIVRLLYSPLDHTKIEFNFLTQFNDPKLFITRFPRYQNDDGSLDYFLK